MISGKTPEVVRDILKLPTTDAVGVPDGVTSRPCVKPSSDGVENVVALNVAESIPAIKKMIKTDNGKQGNGHVIKLRDVNYETLLNVIAWANQQKNDCPTNDDSAASKADNGCWDKMFLNDLESPALLDLLSAARFVGIEWLADLTCKKVQSMQMGKSEETIRETVRVMDDDKDKERNRKLADRTVGRLS